MGIPIKVGGKQNLQLSPVQPFSGQQFPLLMRKASPKSPTPCDRLPCSMIRVAWLRQPGQERAKSARLFKRFSSAGMKISMVKLSHEHSPLLKQIPHFDLILLEHFDHPENEINATLSSIRTESRAPLLMLTNEQTVDWLVNALRAGADAIFTFNTPEEVIFARCNALLRRWLPRS